MALLSVRYRADSLSRVMSSSRFVACRPATAALGRTAASFTSTSAGRAYSVAAITEQLGDPQCRTWVAEGDDGTLVGYAHAGPCKLPHPEVADGSGEIHQIYLRRGTQGTGAGRALFDAALAYLAATRPGPVWLGVWSGNAKAIAFYEKAGFKRVGTYDFKVGESTDLEFIYRR
jgi:diamine N-acetyltransferase